MKFAKLALVIGLLILTSIPLHAQGDGQFCVRAFEDRNGNGGRDAGEPFLQGGVSAHLINASGVIVGTALLDDAPQEMRVSGVICFQSLEAGQYTIEVTSADYRATTPNTLTTAVNEGDIPALLEFGAQSVVAPLTRTTISDEPEPEAIVLRLAVSALGAAVAMVVMALIGVFIYLIAYRGRQPVPQTPTNMDARYRRPVEDNTPPRR